MSAIQANASTASLRMLMKDDNKGFRTLRTIAHFLRITSSCVELLKNRQKTGSHKMFLMTENCPQAEIHVVASLRSLVRFHTMSQS